MDKVYLGKVKAGEYAGDDMYLSVHNWSCGWYWSFGWVGNRNLHTHFDGTFLKSGLYASETFENPQYSDCVWWNIRDLFVQAYALQKAAEVYKYGGHQCGQKSIYGLIVDDPMRERLNKDLETVLNTLWSILETDRMTK